MIGIDGPRRKYKSLIVRRDAASDPQSPILAAHILGEIGGDVIVLEDTVQSRLGGLSYCQSGEETTVRVLAIVHHAISETAHWKVESCVEGIEPEPPPPQLNQTTLSVHWLHAPIAGKGRGTLEARIAANGMVQGSMTPQ